MRATAAAVFVWGVTLLGACKKPEPPAPPVEPPRPAWTKPGPVTFGRVPHVAGEKFIDTLVTSMKQVEGEAVDSESRLVTQVEVLATDGGALDAVRVTYAEESDVDRLAGQGRRGPMHGKTFSVGVVTGELEVKELGSPDAGVSPTERGRLTSDWSWLGKPSPWRAAAGGQAFAYQEASLPIARALADMMTAGWAESTATASARYMGNDGGVADFDVTVDQVMNVSQPRRSSSKLTGSLSLRVKSGELATLQLDGPLQFFEGDTRVGLLQMKVSARRRLAEDVGK